ncbi:AzlC family ABC transporter permease [Luminiphilus sp.]|jgi:4-azaleucine resistance transporter AzlC|nr:AzlC family ABC transporter permease [Luminiphilus sp.]MDA8679816.1 AzlC family ABC transporter permease [Luminiphilus sp.]
MSTKRFSPAISGAASALPLFIPAIPFAFVFGVVVANAGIPEWLGWSSSPIIFGGAIQVTLFTLIGEGASVAAAVSAALVVGARHMLYSVALAPQFQHQPTWFRWVGPYVLIDQVFVLSQLNPIKEPDTFRHYFLAAGFTFWSLWMLFTAIGVVLGPAIPASWGVEFAAPVLFVSLMMAASNRPDKIGAAILAMIITYLFAELPNRAGLLVAVFISVVIMLLITRRGQR